VYLVHEENLKQYGEIEYTHQRKAEGRGQKAEGLKNK
jgi:hypothetical protein